MANRLYIVEQHDAHGKLTDEHLVNAANPASAVYHIAKVHLFSAKAAKAADVARLMAKGAQVQEAGAE